MQEKIWLSPPHMNGKEFSYVKDAFDKNWISPYGENVTVFEKQLEDFFKVGNIALVNSGTSAIHLSLILLGVGIDDEVIAPTLNFAGCINPILYQKATPLFIDSEEDTWNIDPNIVEEVIKSRIKAKKKPKAIIGVHLFGVPCKIYDLLEIGKKYEIPVIEDAADAIGSTVDNKLVGTFGDFGIISFNGNKIVTTSGGGCLMGKNLDLIENAKHLSNQAKATAPHYVHDTVGYNYMMSNVIAGIGRGQMEVINERISKRRYIYDIYKQSFAEVPEFKFRDDLPGTRSNRWLSTMLVNPGVQNEYSRDDIYWELFKNNIESRPVWTPMHTQPAFESFPFFGGNVAENIFRAGLCLPSGSSMTFQEQIRVIDTILSFVADKKNHALSVSR